MVPTMATHTQNEALYLYPNMEKLKRAVFDLSRDSAGSPEWIYCLVLSIMLVHSRCIDIYGMVLSFSKGASLPMSIRHTNLVLLPKKSMVQIFSNIRKIA